MKLEVVVVPVSHVDRAKDFYHALGWRLNADIVADPDFRVMQITLPGSGCAIIFGTGITSALPHGLTTRLPVRATSALAAYDSLTGLAEALRSPCTS